MSKFQEALDCIIGMLNVLPFKRNKDFEKTIQELVDKETPMKPKYEEIRKLSYYFCPVCEEEVRHYYCEGCGQKVDWD